MINNKIYITQQQFQRYLFLLMDKIKDSGMMFDVVVGIENGGLNISVPVAQELQLPHESIKISWYDGETKGDRPTIDVHGFDLNKYKSCLFIDDIVDTGATVKSIQWLWALRPEDAFATLFIKRDLCFYSEYIIHNKIYGDTIFYVQIVPSDTWIVFPWGQE